MMPKVPGNPMFRASDALSLEHWIAEVHSQKTERAARQHPYIQIAFAAEGLLKPKDQEA
jgi:hypothetical protein